MYKTSQPYNFLRVICFATFSSDLNLASNCAFFIPISKKFEKNIFWVILALFANFEVKRERNGLKKLKTYFINVSYNSILLLSMGPDFQFSKKSQNRCSL